MDIIKTNPVLPSYINKLAILNKPNESVIDKNANLKKGIWLYFLLLIFEGALRKWLLPSLATPLLIIRDPIALWLLIMANKRGLVRLNGYLLGITVVTVLATLTAVLLGHGNIFVAIYGARVFVLHFPLIFIIGTVFNKNDVIKIGKFILWLSIPMTLLVVTQFYSPQSAWVNRGIGGDMGGAGFEGANGYFRPPATFSFITGTVSFYGMVACYVIYFWLTPKLISRPILIIASVCLMMTVPLSISRSLFFEVIISLLFGIIVISRNPKFLIKLIPLLLFSVLAFYILGKTGVFQTSSDAFTQRFDSANEQEGGLQSVFLDRFLGGMIGALSGSSAIPFFGFGLGMGTNVGSMLLSGKISYLIAEVEWGRLIGEMGALLGISVILIRVGLVFDMLKKSYKKMVQGNILPWMLLSFGFLNIAQGQWAQPSILGFSALIGGLILAALKDDNLSKNFK